MRGSAPAPQCKGRNPLTNPSGPRSSCFLVYQTQSSIRGQGGDFRHPAFRPAGQPSAVQFCSNKLVHAPGHSFGVIQTMLLVLANFGLERMGRKNSSGYAGWVLQAVERSGFSVGRARYLVTTLAEPLTPNFEWAICLLPFALCACSAPNEMLPA